MRNYIFLADGFEEIEAVNPIDIMRRAGMEVLTVSINDSKKVTGAHGIVVEADITFKQADFADTDWLILPGGMPGATNLYSFTPLADLLKVHNHKGRIAAICASPAVVLGQLGILNGKHATCYPGMEAAAIAGGALMENKRVVVDGNIVTGNGPSSAQLWALTIVAETLGQDAADSVAAGMLV